jgi:hypothetical protein
MNWFANCRVFLTMTLVFLVAASAVAQKPTPSAQEVLARVQAHVAATFSTLPDVFCDEKISSSQLHNGKVKREMTLDSLISVRKLSSGDERLTESRDVRFVDGKPAQKGKKYVLPYTLNGGFGLLFNSFLSSAYDQCNTYRIIEDGASEGNLIVLEVSRKMDSKQIVGCETFLGSAVHRFWLDPASYEIQRIETVDRIPDGPRGFKSFTGRNDFAIVQFGSKTYLLPASVRATATLGPDSSEQFSFEAHYSNCHKFDVSTRILPSSVEEP